MWLMQTELKQKIQTHVLQLVLAAEKGCNFSMIDYVLHCISTCQDKRENHLLSDKSFWFSQVLEKLIITDLGKKYQLRFGNYGNQSVQYTGFSKLTEGVIQRNRYVGIGPTCQLRNYPLWTVYHI